MAFLELQSGLRSGERFQITNERTVIGRHPGCDIVIDASAVSRQHCLVTVVSGEPVIEDLRSRNGTSVNGQTLVGKQVLKDGDAVPIHAGPLGLMIGEFAGAREAVPKNVKLN